MALNAEVIDLLRNHHPHVTQYALSFSKPSQVAVLQVTGTPTQGDRTLGVTTISGDPTLAVANATVWVGTAAGKHDVSVRRFRTYTPGTIKLDENPVAWAAGQYLTILDEHMFWPIYPYMESSGGDFTFYKDYDIPYTSENEFIPPVAIAGGPLVGYLDGASITFSIDLTASYAVTPSATIASYAVECPGATITNPSTGKYDLEFTTAGQRWLKVTVTDSNGVSQTTYRRVFVHTRTGVNAPCYDFELSSPPSGDFSQGGWNMRVTLHSGATVDDIPDGTLVVLWAEEKYDGTAIHLGSWGNLRMVGYIKSESVVQDPQGGSVEFEVTTLHDVMSQYKMYSISLEELPAGETMTWYRFLEGTLTIARAAHHVWKWHTTLLEITDVFLPMENTNRMAATDDMADGTVYSQMEWAYSNGIFAKTVCSRTNSLHLERDILMLTDAERAAKPTQMTLTDTDLRSDTQLTFIRNTQKKAASVIASGIAWDGAGYKPLLSQAPGTVPDAQGSDDITMERLALADQTELNFICGRLLALYNVDIDEFRLGTAGNYPFDIVPQVWWAYNLTDNKRGIVKNTKLVPRQVSDIIDTVVGESHCEVVFNLEVASQPGITQEYPEEPDTPPSPPPPDTPPYTPPNFPGIPPLPPIYIPPIYVPSIVGAAGAWASIEWTYENPNPMGYGLDCQCTGLVRSSLGLTWYGSAVEFTFNLAGNYLVLCRSTFHFNGSWPGDDQWGPALFFARVKHKRGLVERASLTMPEGEAFPFHSPDGTSIGPVRPHDSFGAGILANVALGDKLQVWVNFGSLISASDVLEADTWIMSL